MKSYHDQIAVIEQIMCLRPYNIDMVTSNVILGELETRVEDSFTLADLIAFAEGADEHVMKMYKDSGSKLLVSQRHWMGVVPFHREMERLWGELREDMQKRLGDGQPLSMVMGDLEAEMMRANKSKCRVLPTFSFE